MKYLIEQLQKYHRHERNLSIFGQMLESVVGLIVSGVVGYMIAESVSRLTIILTILMSVTYMWLLIQRIYRNAIFPLSALGELEATNREIEIREKLEQSEIHYTYIDNAIQALNSHTCTIGLGYGGPNDLCTQNLKDGLRSALLDFISHPQNILGCHRKRFTVGIYLDTFYRSPWPGEQVDMDTVDQLMSSCFFTLRDDFGFEHKGNIYEDVFHDGVASGVGLSVQNTIRYAMNNNQFRIEPCDFDGENYTVLASPVPNVCEINLETGEEAILGGIVVICKATNDIKPEVAKVLRIFGRIVSNWVSKYEECVIHQISHRQSNGQLPESINNGQIAPQMMKRS